MWKSFSLIRNPNINYFFPLVIRILIIEDAEPLKSNKIAMEDITSNRFILFKIKGEYEEKEEDKN